MEALSLPTLWLAVCPDAPPIAWEAQLSASEQSWLQTLKAPQRRRQMLCARTLAREALAAHYPSCAPSEISLSAGEGVAPALTGAFKGVHLSLAHSKELCACLIDSDPCGVDIEYNLTDREFDAIAEKIFEGPQVQALRRLPSTRQQGHFYRLWCAHEAILKCAQPASCLHGGTHGSFTLSTATVSRVAQIPVRLADLSAGSSRALKTPLHLWAPIHLGQVSLI